MIQSEINAITSGESRTWGQISHLLLFVEISRYYCQKETTTHSFRDFAKPVPRQSFTSWLKSFAENTGINESTLWRYLSAGRYYQQLAGLDVLRHVSILSLPLNQISEDISPESLEILRKIARVAPTEHFISLVEKLLNGDVTRSDLRNVWEAYRPVLEGENIRGRGPRPKQVVPEEIKRREKYYEATVGNALLASDGKWIDRFDPRGYNVFFNISVNVPDISDSFEFSAVAAVRAENGDVYLHGIEISKRLDLALAEQFFVGTLLSDYMWLILREINDEDLESKVIPKHIGILVVENNEIYVVRQAQKIEESGSQLGSLAKVLLAKLL